MLIYLRSFFVRKCFKLYKTVIIIKKNFKITFFLLLCANIDRFSCVPKQSQEQFLLLLIACLNLIKELQENSAVFCGFDKKASLQNVLSDKKMCFLTKKKKL